MVDDGRVLEIVIPDALKNASLRILQHDYQGILTPSKVRDVWITALREAFAKFYKSQLSQRTFAVFGGKPTQEEPQIRVLPTGVSGWPRWEFLHDVAVVELAYVDAAFARDVNSPSGKRQVAVVEKAVWQVESEIAGNGTKVAEDASKLRVGFAMNKLLVACLTGQRGHEKWLDFLVRLMDGVDGERFVALVPNYGRPLGFAKWKWPTIPFELYRCGPNPGERHRLLWESGS